MRVRYILLDESRMMMLCMAAFRPRATRSAPPLKPNKMEHSLHNLLNQSLLQDCGCTSAVYCKTGQPQDSSRHFYVSHANASLSVRPVQSAVGESASFGALAPGACALSAWLGPQNTKPISLTKALATPADMVVVGWYRSHQIVLHDKHLCHLSIVSALIAPSLDGTMYLWLLLGMIM